ncbi:membrane protein insertion efficiency factor YidD [Polynucleobacter sp.]|uniref:membrane protein insertion efficiency factor YidD n=1 Tax=Polynucleobacter sp. TaxID=2029855 RepID=UPI0037C843C4
MRLFNKLAIKVVRLYQVALSPFIGMHCKFSPSCSQYACDCFTNYGFLKSFGLIVWRILRCNPWSQGGYDPAVKPTPHH